MGVKDQSKSGYKCGRKCHRRRRIEATLAAECDESVMVLKYYPAHCSDNRFVIRARLIADPPVPSMRFDVGAPAFDGASK